MTVRELKKTDWPHIEALFGERGACGGCWCMWWRREKGGKSWEAVRGNSNKRDFKKLVESGQARGILAFDRQKPVGWCSFGKRTEFPRLERTKAYRREDGHKVWSLNCFYIAPGYRKQGLARAMAEAAVKAVKKRKGRRVEAYPVTLTSEGKRLPPAFAFTGPESIFQELDFKEVQRLAPTRPLYRLELP